MVSCQSATSTRLEEVKDDTSILKELYDLTAEWKGCGEQLLKVKVHSGALECVLMMLQDWLSPARHLSHVEQVAQWDNEDLRCISNDCSLTPQPQPTNTPSTLNDETVSPTGERPRNTGRLPVNVLKPEQPVEEEQKIVDRISQFLLQHVIKRHQAPSYAAKLFSELTTEKMSRLETYLIENGPEFINGLLPHVVLEATSTSRDDALQCLLHILSIVVDLYGYYVDCLSTMSRTSHTDFLACISSQENLSRGAKRLSDHGKFKVTLFRLAVAVANVELVQELLKSSNNENSLMSSSEFMAGIANGPLHTATGLGLQLWASVLPDEVNSDFTLKFISTLNTEKETDQIPLFYAELLSDEGDNEYWGMTALQTKWRLLNSIQCENYELVVEMLLDHGADVRATDGNEQTPLDIAESLSLNSKELTYAILSDAVRSQTLDSTPDLAWPVTKLPHKDDTNLTDGKTCNILIEVGRLYPSCTSHLSLITRKYAKTIKSIIFLLQTHNTEVPRKRWSDWAAIEPGSSISEEHVQESCLLKDQKVILNCSGDVLEEGHSKKCDLCSLDIRKFWRSDVSLKLLLDLGVSVNATDVRGQTALHVAAEMNRSVTAKMLLDRGADVTIQDCHGDTPLVVAINWQSWLTVRTLIDNKEDIAKISHGEVLVHSVFDDRVHDPDEGHMAFQRKFYLGYYESEADSHSWSLESGQDVIRNKFISDIFKDLFRNGFDVNAKDFDHNSLLHAFCNESEVNEDMLMFFVQLLLDCGAEINAQNVYGQTPLHHALEGLFDVATCLLANGANANLTDDSGDTPFHLDLTYSNEGSYCEYYDQVLEMQQRLGLDCKSKFPAVSKPNLIGRRAILCLKSALEQHNIEGADFDTDCFGNNMLHWMSARGTYQDRIIRENILEQISNCSSYEVLNSFGLSPVHTLWQCWCRSRALSELDEFREDNMRYIEAKRGALKPDSQGRNVWHYASVNSELSQPKDIMHAPILWKLLRVSSARRLCNEKDHYGRTPLHYTAMLYSAASSGDDNDDDVSMAENWREALPIFAESVNERDVYGRVPLHYMNMNGSVTQCDDVMMNFLLEHTPDKVEDICGYTPQQIKKSLLKTQVCAFTDHDHYDTDLIQFARSCLSNTERTFMNSHQNKQNVTDDIWKIWTVDCHCGEMFNGIRDVVVSFMTRLTDAICKEDPAFQSRLVPVGSSFEGTQVENRSTISGEAKLLYDFDFTVELTNFSKAIEVHEQKATGVVVFRKSQSEVKGMDEKLQKFFNDDGYLESHKVNIAFRCAAIKVLSTSEFWLDEPYIEIADFDRFYRLREMGKCLKLTLRFTRPINGSLLNYHVSVDIVPALRINGWWPVPAVGVLDKRLQECGCYFVFGKTFGRKFKFSTTQCAQVTFAPIDSQLMKDSRPIVKASYIVAKEIAAARDLNVKSIALKMAALWSERDDQLQEDSVGTQPSSTFDDITPSALRTQVGKLFCTLMQFVYQDFVPHVLLPSYQLPLWKENRTVGEFHRSLNLRGLSCEKMFQLWCRFDSFDHTDDALDYAFYLFNCYCVCSLISTDHVPWRFPEIQNSVF